MTKLTKKEKETLRLLGEKTGKAGRAPMNIIYRERDLLSIVWIDSSIENEQHDLRKPFKVAVIESVGFCVTDCGEFIAITRDWMGDDARGTLIIPHKCVRHIKKLRYETEVHTNTS